MGLLLTLLLVPITAVSLQKVQVLKEDDVLWGFGFLPDRRVVYTLREGRMKLFDPATKKTVELKGLPAVTVVGQGGLLDVLVDRDFTKNKKIYWTYSHPVGDRNTTALATARLEGVELKDIKILKVAHAIEDSRIHFGSRLAQDEHGFLYWSVGDRNARDKAQELGGHHGKILRVDREGLPPKDNPFVGQKGALPEIWSYGHRNPQGLFYDLETKTLWENEHGPRGGDELNRIEKGKNYGWPVITYGREYHGPKIGTEKKGGMEQPVRHYVPSISPAGLLRYRGAKFKEWSGDFLMGALSARHLHRLKMKGEQPIGEERLFEDEQRVRDVREGSDGSVWFSTDQGHLYKIDK